MLKVVTLTRWTNDTRHSRLIRMGLSHLRDDRGVVREGKMKLLIEIMIVVWLIDKGINIAEFMIQVLFIYMFILAIAKIIGG